MSTDPAATEWMQKYRAPPKPTSVFETNPDIAAHDAFDRRTQEPVPFLWLRTYAEALADYHLHAEAKFHGGSYLDCGILERRHIDAIAIRHIGKEAHNWELEYFLGHEGDNGVEFNGGVINPERLVSLVRSYMEKFGVRALCNTAGISPKTLKRIRDGDFGFDRDALVKAVRAGYVLTPS